MSVEIRSEEEIVKLGIEYAERILNIKKQIAECNADIKELKREARLDGIPVGLVTKAINKIKAELKKSEAELFEEEAWYDKLKESETVVDKIAELNNV